METITRNGARIAYRDAGSGEPLLLVHAFPMNGAMWQPQIDGLAQRFRVIAPDLRGFGASAYGAGVRSLDDYADDLVALLDHLDIPQMTLGGLSMGGYIAFAMLRRYAERVRALVLADTKAAADADEAKQTRERNARLVETEGVAPLAERMLPTLLSSTASAEQRAQVRAMIAANHPEGIAAALRAMALRPDASAQLGAIAVPTLIIVGAGDTLTPPSAARTMQAAISGSHLAELPGAAHLSNLEAPQAFNAAVLDWHARIQ